MYQRIPNTGAATEAVQAQAHRSWADEARKANIDLATFDDAAPLSERITWAKSKSLSIGAVLSRSSMMIEHNTAAQVQACVEYAARNLTYVPPEFVCVDEATTGRGTMRDGVERIKAIFRYHSADVLLVYNFSRLFRVWYKGLQFIRDYIVDKGIRVISVSQGINSADKVN